MALTFEEFLAINDPGGTGVITAPAPLAASERAGNVTAAALYEEWDRLGLIASPTSTGSGSGTGAANARASRAAALKQLTIQRKKLEFQQKTGLRDISQARESGLKGAINNALQRGIFRSGIRIENEAEVNRESDEARDDLKTNIQFALDDLAARREGVEAQRFSSGSGSGGGGGPIDIATAEFLANESARAQRETILEGPDSGFTDSTSKPPSTGVVPIVQPGGPQ